MNPLLIGGILDKVADIADDLFTSDEERGKLLLEAQQLDATLLKAQMEVNKAEATHKSIFVAGWRPGFGWIGVVAMGYQFILYPLLTWAWVFLQAKGVIPQSIDPPPLLDIEALMVLVTGMLGVAGMRTAEKMKKVAS